ASIAKATNDHQLRQSIIAGCPTASFIKRGPNGRRIRIPSTEYEQWLENWLGDLGHSTFRAYQREPNIDPETGKDWLEGWNGLEIALGAIALPWKVAEPLLEARERLDAPTFWKLCKTKARNNGLQGIELLFPRDAALFGMTPEQALDQSVAEM